MPKLPSSLRKEPDSLATDARIKLLSDQVGQLCRGDVPGIARQFMQ